MRKTFSKNTFLGIFATIYSVVVFIWFTNIEGMLGTFNWHIEYKSIYILLCVLLPLPAVFMAVSYFKGAKWSRRLTAIFSVLNILIWSAWFGILTGLTNVKVDNSGVSLISKTGNIPSKSSIKAGEPLIHLAFGSDPHFGSSRANKEARRKIMKMVNAEDYDAFYVLGDIAEMGCLAGDYNEALGEMRAYLPDTKILTIPGNHDVILNGLKLYESIFNEKGDKNYFRMDNGSVHFLFVNMLWDDTELNGKQLRWLETQLKKIPQSETVIVMAHCYVVSSGVYDSLALKHWGDIPGVMKKICPLLEKYNVDLFMSGHDHFFEYLEKDNVPYLVLGAMGGALDEDVTYNSPYSKWLDNKTFGYVDMKIYEDYLEFNCISSEGKVLYSKSLKTDR